MGSAVEIWEAVGFRGMLNEASRTRPLVLICERQGHGSPTISQATTKSPLLNSQGKPLDATTKLVIPSQYEIDQEGDEPDIVTREFVVKALGCPEVLEVTLFKELFGNLLAREFGISTPAPALIVLSEAFVSATKRQVPADIRLRSGSAVGCEYLAGLSPIGSNFKLSPALLTQAAQLYAFDLLTTNPDRRINNPNCAFHNGQLLAYDFESAFSFVEALFGPQPWQVSRLRFPVPHVFQAQLGRKGADWQPFVNCLESIDEAKLLSLIKDCPREWLVHCERIFDHIFKARDASNRLMLELEETLRVIN